MPENVLTMEVVEPADVNPQHRAQLERFKRNSDWLQSHWDDLLPRARGKHLVVAGQEALIADTPEEAWALARAAHPEADGVLSQYVFPNKWPRIFMRGEFAAFTDRSATDLSILGRDVLNHFELILSRRRNEVLLLAPNHHYRVEQA